MWPTICAFWVKWRYIGRMWFAFALWTSPPCNGGRAFFSDLFSFGEVLRKTGTTVIREAVKLGWGPNARESRNFDRISRQSVSSLRIWFCRHVCDFVANVDQTRNSRRSRFAILPGVTHCMNAPSISQLTHKNLFHLSTSHATLSTHPKMTPL